MKYIYLIWICSLGLVSFHSPRPHADASIELQIIGKWYLLDQEMLINGKEIHQHFEEVAASLSSKSGYQLDPYILAEKFRKGFRGIPSGTVFEFNDDFSYQIILPDKQVQRGLWRVKNAQTIVLNAEEQQMHMEIKSMEDGLATVSIKEEKIDSEMDGGRYVKMELIIDLSR